MLTISILTNFISGTGTSVPPNTLAQDISVRILDPDLSLICAAILSLYSTYFSYHLLGTPLTYLFF